jgi:hypothetical protein
LARSAACLFLAIALLGLQAQRLEAQEQEPFSFNISRQTGAAELLIGDFLSDPSLLEAVHSGLPLRIRIRIQLWRDGFFDDQEGREHDWRASIVFDPLTRRYGIQSSMTAAAEEEEEVNTLDEVRLILQRRLAIPLLPARDGRYYYNAVVEMETLSLTDLEELRRWLKGDLAPAIGGERDVDGALAKGLRRILVRVLGLPARRFDIQSEPFQIGGNPA